MTQAVFMQVQSTAGAILEIAGMLIIAGLIAWLTSYYYYRSVYRKKLAEKDEIIHQREEKISYLETDNRNLNNKLTSLEKENERLNKELQNALSEISKLRESGNRVV